MVKVINQDIPAEEVTYDPDPARPFTLGQAYQQAMTEGATGTTPPGSEIIRKSPIAGRPPTRGTGTAAQAPVRDCFKACGAAWRGLPQYFKDCVKEIYNQNRPPPKDKDIPPEGYSTPWSTFLGQCMAWCRENGPENINPQLFFDCPDPRCTGADIGHTTTQMFGGETQELTVENPNPQGTYSLVILSGGGSIDEDGVYTAPEENENCAQNATIALMCFGTIVATLEIATSIQTSGNAGWAAYCSKMSEGIGGNCFDCYAQIVALPLHCDGSVGTTISGCTQTAGQTVCPPYGCPDVWEELCSQSSGMPFEYPVGCWPGGGVPYGDNVEEAMGRDQRTSAQLLAGCCPTQLF
jgi:hypothetical protein